MYDRIAGVTASDATLTSMVGMDATQAALTIVTKDPAFYNNTIRNLAMPWTNRDQTVFAPLNDYVATVVGMVAEGLSSEEIVADYPDLDPEDVSEALRFAAEAVRERELPLVACG